MFRGVSEPAPPEPGAVLDLVVQPGVTDSPAGKIRILSVILTSPTSFIILS